MKLKKKEEFKMARKTKETKVVNYIPLIKDYYFSADDNQYILYQKSICNKIDFYTKKVLDEMVESIDIIGYYTSISGLMQSCIINLNRNSIADGDIKTLKECIEQINNTYEELKSILEAYR